MGRVADIVHLTIKLPGPTIRPTIHDAFVDNLICPILAVHPWPILQL